jgi:hypothetical protein
MDMQGFFAWLKFVAGKERKALFTPTFGKINLIGGDIGRGT